MTGSVAWDQIVFLTMLIVSVGTGSFLIAWRIQSHLKEERHATKTSFEQRTQSLDDKIDLIVNAFEKRLSSIEIFNAGTLVVLEHLKEFRDEVKKQYEELKKERKDDMHGLHRRLDALKTSED